MNVLFRRILALAVLWAAAAQGQVVVTLQSARTQFVVGEAIPLTVTITNHSGQDLLLQNDGRRSWLDFVVLADGKQPVSAVGRSAFGAVRIPAGQTMSREVDLKRLFRVTEIGSYSAYAVVCLPGTREREGFNSNRVLFNTTTARPYWTQKFGVGGQTREYRVLQYEGNHNSQLYVQVADGSNGTLLQTYSLGEALLFRKPQITVDRAQNLHVFYLVSPTLWAHSRIGPDGRFLGRELHQRGADEPTLLTQADGSVSVSGGSAFQAGGGSVSGKVHKAGDRPAYIFK